MVCIFCSIVCVIAGQVDEEKSKLVVYANIGLQVRLAFSHSIILAGHELMQCLQSSDRLVQTVTVFSISHILSFWSLHNIGSGMNVRRFKHAIREAGIVRTWFGWLCSFLCCVNATMYALFCV